MEFGLGFVLILVVIIWILYDENQILKRRNSDSTTLSLGEKRRFEKEKEEIKERDNKNYKKILNKSNDEKTDWLLSNINFQNDHLIHWTKNICDNNKDKEFPYLFSLSLELISFEIVNHEIDIKLDQNDFLTRFITKRLFEIRDKTNSNKSIPELNQYSEQIYNQLTKNMMSNHISIESIKFLFLGINVKTSVSDEEIIRVTRGTILNNVDSLRKVYKSLNF
jgi:hypothetical protein